MNCSKFLTVKDDWEARRAALLTATLTTVGMLVFFIPPITARLLIPDEIATLVLNRPAEGSYAGIAMYLLPPGLVGLVLVAMCAATMSSLDGGLTGLAAVVTQNAYPALCRCLSLKPAEGAARLRLGRAVTLGCAATLIAVTLGLAHAGGARGVFGLVLDIIAILLAPVGLPMALGLWVRDVPWWTPAVTIVSGLVMALAVAFLPQLLGTGAWLYHERVFAVVGIGLLVFFACRHWGGALDIETAEREREFFALRDRPIDFAQEVGIGNDARQMSIMGLFAWALSLAFLLLTFPRSSQGHGLKFVVLAVTSAVIGLALQWRARHHESKS